ncbi:hypothetical protein Gorai_022510, partial [Gossypium raimondii]|nr:hypothetical protein [Gossypium raimondii]
MEDVDRISDLPDSILTYILSFLSTKEAVGTSILSSRWRYIFTLVPNLHFDLVDDLCHKNLESCILHIKSFISFFDKPLSLHETSLDRFHLKCGEMVHGPRVYSWISTAVRRGVKHLDISISPDQFTSPGIMFTCRSLTTLKLDFTCSVLDVPRGVPFPNLKTLHLNHDCRLMLDTPNLAYFKYGNLVIAGHPLENLKSMNSAFIQSAFSNFRNYATALFRGISNVHSLVLTYNSLKSSCEYADLLINVKWSSSMDKGLEILLSSSPELEKLACHQEVLSKLPEKVVYCLLSKLKVMEILGFRNDKDVIEKA